MSSQRVPSDDGRHRFAAGLQSALTLDEVQRAYLGSAKAMICADGYGLYRLDPDSGAVLGVAADVESDFLDDYEAYGRDDDPVLDFVTREQRPIDSSRVVPVQRWEGCGARSALGRGGYYHSLEAPVVVAGVLYGTINFARPGAHGPFSDVDLVSARLACEQLGLATERALRFEATGRRATLLEDVLDRIPQAVVVTDLEARVLFRNRAADRAGAGTGPRGGASVEGVVGESISEAMEGFRRDGKRVTARSVRDERSGRPLVVKSYRLPDHDDAALTLVFPCADQEARRLPAWEVLSPREQEIAQLVSEGLTTKQIAERAFVSENTVKQHLKRVFAKTDVRNRAELMQRIWSSGVQAQQAGSTAAG